MNEAGYVVIVFNQASGQPDLAAGASLHWSEGDARDECKARAEETASIGRRETYRVAEATLLEEKD